MQFSNNQAVHFLLKKFLNLRFFLTGENFSFFRKILWCVEKNFPLFGKTFTFTFHFFSHIRMTLCTILQAVFIGCILCTFKKGDERNEKILNF